METAMADKVLDLVKAQRTFAEKHEFKVGDLIQWKKGLRNKTSPEYGEPLVIVEFLDKPTRASKDTRDAYFAESIDILCGNVKPRREVAPDTAEMCSADDLLVSLGIASRPRVSRIPDSEETIFLMYAYDSRRFEPFKAE